VVKLLVELDIVELLDPNIDVELLASGVDVELFDPRVGDPSADAELLCSRADVELLADVKVEGKVPLPE
jgi:hypothetical protein